ncbi:MAG: Mur ligase family protein, partial [Planctomycetota bacterium]
GRLMGERHGVAIAGTHGKTTTSSLVVHALCELGKDPSYVVGAVVRSQGRAGASGSGDLFVAEACEYSKSFLDLTFRSATICSVEPDHLDTYGDPRAMRDAYRRFASKLPEGGRLCLTPAGKEALGGGLPGHLRITTVGLLETADIRAVGLSESGGFFSFGIDGELKSGRLDCPVPGRHFAEDLLLAAATLSGLGVKPIDLRRALSTYTNPSRRLETVVDGEIGLISDYAHHPTELLGVHETMRRVHPGRRLLAVFQPHQASRTRFFLADFARTLACFDLTLVADIYCTRDSPADQAAVSSRDLAAGIAAAGGRGEYTGSLAQTLRVLLGKVRSGDLILLLGAGDIDELRDEIEAALSNKN